jgi:surface protein
MALKMSKNKTTGTVLFCLVWVCLGVTPQVFANSKAGKEFECFTTRLELLRAIRFYVQNQHPETYVARQYGYPLDTWCLDGVESLEDAFFGVFGVESFQADLSNWNVSSVTSLSRAFFGGSSLNFDVSAWDTSRVTDMKQTFQLASAFTGQGLEKWNVAKVTNFKRMFDKATSLNVNLCVWGDHLSPLAAPVHVHVMGMFQGASSCPSEQNPDIGLDPEGPFCHVCANHSRQQTGVLTGILMEQDQGAAQIDGQYSSSSATVQSRPSARRAIIVMATISTIAVAMTAVAF